MIGQTISHDKITAKLGEGGDGGYVPASNLARGRPDYRMMLRKVLRRYVP